MSSFIRTTRECSISQVNPTLARAIREYFQKHQVGDPESGTLLCCETIGEKQNPDSLVSRLDGNPDTKSFMAIILTAEWLIWGKSGERSGTVVTGARLKVITVKAFVAKRTKDMVLEVSGFINETKELVRGNLEMGPEPAAQKLCEEVGAAVLIANPPVKSKWPKWMGG
jgi:hypothetical protein